MAMDACGVCQGWGLYTGNLLQLMLQGCMVCGAVAV